MTTTHDKVLQAVGKAMELVATKRAKELEVRDFKILKLEVDQANNVDELLEEMVADMATVTETSESVYQDVIKEARVPLDKAESAYETKCQTAQALRDSEIGDVKTVWDQKIVATTEERGIAAATAQADLHAAAEAVASLQSQINKYQQKVKKELGIDLDSLLTVAQGTDGSS